MKYENLMMQYPNINFYEKRMPRGLSGLYYENVIEIDRYLTYKRKHEIVAEELGHFEKTVGDISDYSCLKNRKQEELARRWAMEKIVSLDDLIECYEEKLRTAEEISFHLEITTSYLIKVISYYKVKYGNSYEYKGYWFNFIPLVINKLT